MTLGGRQDPRRGPAAESLFKKLVNKKITLNCDKTDCVTERNSGEGNSV